MPFDGSSISRELFLLGGLLEFFEDVDRWVRHMFSDGEGRACLVGALRITRQRLNIGQDRATAYLSRAIRQHHHTGGLQLFNDHLCSDIEELQDTVRFACALAAVYPPDGLPHAPGRPARYAPSSFETDNQSPFQPNAASIPSASPQAGNIPDRSYRSHHDPPINGRSRSA
jgi:hypothetical protein